MLSINRTPSDVVLTKVPKCFAFKLACCEADTQVIIALGCSEFQRQVNPDRTLRTKKRKQIDGCYPRMLIYQYSTEQLVCLYVNVLLLCHHKRHRQI